MLPTQHTFVIWGLVFLLFGFFVVYQASQGWFFNRNDDFIFNVLGYRISIIFALQSLWAFFYVINTTWGYIFSFLIVSAMVFLAIWCLIDSLSVQFNVSELVCIRYGLIFMLA